MVQAPITLQSHAFLYHYTYLVIDYQRNFERLNFEQHSTENTLILHGWALKNYYLRKHDQMSWSASSVATKLATLYTMCFSLLSLNRTVTGIAFHSPGVNCGFISETSVFDIFFRGFFALSAKWLFILFFSFYFLQTSFRSGLCGQMDFFCLSNRNDRHFGFKLRHIR